MTDDLALIHSPAGPAGSGRVRYGAAMALYRAGLITEAQLEVYRITAAHDGRDPVQALADQGLPPPPRPAPAPDAAAALATLADEAARYLSALAHPGAAEVQAGLSRRSGPPRLMAPAGNAVVDQWLAPALTALGATHPGLAAAIAGAAPHLPWVTYDAYPRALIGDAFATGHAFASLIGAGAPWEAADFDLGLFLIAPDVLYRDHAHAAPELYAPLTGPHGWRFGPGRPLVLKPAHQPVWNDPFRPHLTKVGPLPFLAFFVWTRDVNAPAEAIAADDWPELEALRL